MTDPTGTRALAGAILRRNALPAEPPARLVVLEGPEPGRAVLLDAEETLGRGAAASLRFDAPGLSRLHLRFSAEAGEVWAEDLGSKNGTRVNGRRLRRSRRKLEAGDVLAAGGVRLRLLAGPPSPAAGPPGRGAGPHALAAAVLLLALALWLLGAG